MTTPVELADTLGHAYAATLGDADRKNLGIYFTPPAVARFMARLFDPRTDSIRILDPAAGSGILLAALLEHLVQQQPVVKSITAVAYELDAGAIAGLNLTLKCAAQFAQSRGVELTIDIRHKDFVLDQASLLRMTEVSTFGHLGEPFDMVIANPPYFKLQKKDPRAVAAASLVHGQPNIYGLFMGIGVASLKGYGQIVTITPRSFTAGPYFKRFRERFFASARPSHVHIFNSRKDAFNRDDILQETIILHASREDGWTAKDDSTVLISSSHGARDLAQATMKRVPLADAYNPQSVDKVLRLITSDYHSGVVRVVHGWTGSLGRFGLKISTGPVVPFRATDLIAPTGESPKTHAPLLWMNHVTHMRTRWPIGEKQEYIRNTAVYRTLLLPNANYVLIRRFTAKEEPRRLVAAPYLSSSMNHQLLGIENHLNYIYRPHGSMTEAEVIGIAALLNSRLMDDYFRTSSGNTQVSATELRALLLPDLHEITRLGTVVNLTMSLEEVDAVVDRFVARFP